jgi:hypothetical protein
MKNILILLIINLFIHQLSAQNIDSNIKTLLTSNQLKANLMQTLIEEGKFIEICSRPEKELMALESNETNITGIAHLIVYDLLGNKIYITECMFTDGKCTKIDLEHIKNGVYFLHLSNPSNSITRKIILD